MIQFFIVIETANTWLDYMIVCMPFSASVSMFITCGLAVTVAIHSIGLPPS